MSFYRFTLIAALLAVGWWSLASAQLVLAGTPTASQAAEDLCRGRLGGDSSPICEPTDVFLILSKVLRYVYTIFFIVAVIFILVAAFQFLFAQGEAEKIKSARWAITWAVVAIAIALISIGAAQLIRSFLTP